MLIHDQQVYALVVKKLRGQATPTEILELEQWASLNANNKSWLNRVDNPGWLESTLEKDHEEQQELPRWLEDFHRRLAEREADDQAWEKFWSVNLMLYNKLLSFLSSFRVKK